MKINILRRIEAVEQMVRQSAEPPSLIMIHYDGDSEKWIVTEHYAFGNRKSEKDYRAETSTFDRLQDFFFPDEFVGRVILETFGNVDPMIYEGFLAFDIDDLREGQTGDIAIQSISEPEDENSIMVSVDTCSKQK